MAKYGAKAQQAVEREMKAFHQGKLTSGSGRKVTNPKQAVAIGLSEARREGAKVPPAPAGRSTAAKRKSSAKKTAAKQSRAKQTRGSTNPSRKRAAKKSPASKTAARKTAARTTARTTKNTKAKSPTRPGTRAAKRA